MIKKKVEVILLRNFQEDQRTSMENYADNLKHALQKNNNFYIKEIRPNLKYLFLIPKLFFNNKIRFARYIYYPLMVIVRKKLKNQIYHILDHAYGHLILVLNRKTIIITVHDIIPLLSGRGLIKGVNVSRRSWLFEFSTKFYKALKKINRLIV